MSLYVYVMNPELRAKVRSHLENRRPTDSGFDLLSPETTLNFSTGRNGVELKLGVVCAARTYLDSPAPFLLLARSSTSLTPLRMSNQIGLADMGYRGELIARVDSVDPTLNVYPIEEGRRLFQIVQHNWMPWTSIRVVDELDELPAAPDARGGGGFGSTGN